MLKESLYDYVCLEPEYPGPDLSYIMCEKTCNLLALLTPVKISRNKVCSFTQSLTGEVRESFPADPNGRSF